MQVIASIRKSIFLTVFICQIPTGGAALGEPTGNFRLLMNYMFRTQFDSLQVLREFHGLKSWVAMKLPTDRPALVKMDPFQQSLTCENVRLKSFDDWPEIFETAVKNYEAGTDERITVHPRMWTGFVDWYTPALTITKKQLSWRMNIKSAQVTAAVLNDGFDFDRVFHHKGDGELQITNETLQKLTVVHGWNFRSLLENQLGDKKIRLRDTVFCDGFTIYHIDITRR